jgi:hypothetical protein
MGTKHMKSVRIWLSFLLGIGQYVVYIGPVAGNFSEVRLSFEVFEVILLTSNNV